MTNYLIPYVDPKKLKGHMDPVLEEFSYGDIRQRGKILRHNIGKGSFLFFHIGKYGRWLGVVCVHRVNVNAELVEKRHVEKYEEGN